MTGRVFFFGLVLGPFLIAGLAGGCSAHDMEQVFHVGGKIVYDSMKAVSQPPRR